MGNYFLKQIIHTSLFGELDWEKKIKYISSTGAEGVDMAMSAEGNNSSKVLLHSGLKQDSMMRGLKVFSFTPRYYKPNQDLSSADKRMRKNAINFVILGVDTAEELDCDRILISPSWISNTHDLVCSYEDHWKYAVDSISEVAIAAQKKNITLMIEPINRYRVALIHTAKEAMKMISEIGFNNVQLVLDTYHMNIEESESIIKTLDAAGKYMKCLHIGDNTRYYPGSGALDWKGILLKLEEIQFSGPLSHELMYLYFNEIKSLRME